MSAVAAGERVLFEASVSRRYALVALWSALALGGIYFAAFVSPPFGVFYAADPLLLAIRECNRVALRVTESTIQHQQPGWMSSLLTLTRASTGLKVKARDVAGAEWLGHDNIGIRLKNGSVELVSFTHRISAARQAAARRAIVEFIEQAVGSAIPPQPEVATWTVRPS